MLLHQIVFFYSLDPYEWLSYMGEDPIWVKVLFGWTSRMGEPLVCVNTLYGLISHMGEDSRWVNVPYGWMCHIYKCPIPYDMVERPIWLNFPYGWISHMGDPPIWVDVLYVLMCRWVEHKICFNVLYGCTSCVGKIPLLAGFFNPKFYQYVYGLDGVGLVDNRPSTD